MEVVPGVPPEFAKRKAVGKPPSVGVGVGGGDGGDDGVGYLPFCVAEGLFAR